MVNTINGFDLLLLVTVILLVFKVVDLKRELKFQGSFLKTCHREMNNLRERYNRLKVMNQEKHCTCNKIGCHQ